MTFSFEIEDKHLQRFSEMISNDRTIAPEVAIQQWLDKAVQPIKKTVLSEEVHSDPEVVAAKEAYETVLAQKLGLVEEPTAPGMLQQFWNNITGWF